MSSPSPSAPASESVTRDARSVQIAAGASIYEALVGPGAGAEIGEAVLRAGLKGRPRVIADRNVWQRFGPPIEASLRALGRDVYIFQATMDTRPEDLLVTPVVAGAGEIQYVASSLVTAMIRGGVCVLDEGNRMSEKSWASLAPLLDIEADRHADIVVHARVHREQELAAARAESRLELVETPQGPVRIVDEQLELMRARVVAADGEA